MRQSEIDKATPETVATWLAGLTFGWDNFQVLSHLVGFCFRQWYANRAALRQQKTANQELREQNKRLKTQLRTR